MTVLFLMYWMLDEKYRWILLLAASYLFYFGWGAVYLVILISLTLLSYTAGIMIWKNKGQRCGKIFTITVIAGMVFILCGFKYSLFEGQPFALEIMMPIGMSFYTFMIIGYLADIYHGQTSEYHLGRYALFVAFFPEISSGPIGRDRSLLAQLSKAHIFNYDQATYGLNMNRSEDVIEILH